jgi:hypothetical protein
MKLSRELGPDIAVRVLLVALAGLGLPACKRGTDAGQTTGHPPKRAQITGTQARAEDALVQQAADSCRQRIQAAAQEHADNAKRLQEAGVLSMNGVTQREQLEARRALVRRFLASNEALKTLLVNEKAGFAAALSKLQVPQLRIDAELRAFQSPVQGKAMIFRKREADQRFGDSLLGALNSLDELWGQWNYNKEYDQIQFSPPGALKKYNDFLDAIEAASREQKDLSAQ